MSLASVPLIAVPKPAEIKRLEPFITRTKGAPLEETIVRSYAENRVLASSNDIVNALLARRQERTIYPAFGCRSGTLIAFTLPGEPFGEKIEIKDPKTGINYMLAVPVEFRNERNCAIVAQHGDYIIEKDPENENNRLVTIRNAALITEFAPKPNWYGTDEEHGIPRGKPINHDRKYARFIMRHSENYIGCIALYATTGMDDIRGLMMIDAPSDPLGAVAESL
jgi:hypothetical protein